MFGRKKTEDDPLTALARCIIFLDDIRAYRRKDPEMIDKSFSILKKSKYREHYDMWVKLRPSVEKIVDMPSEAPGVKQMIRNLAWMKVANRIFLIFLVVFIAIQIVPVWRNALGDDPFAGKGFMYTAIAVLLVVFSLNLATVMDYRIRKRIIRFENETTNEYAQHREKMKDGVNKMMRTLGREIERTKSAPSSWSLILYFSDYDHMAVEKQWKPKSIGLFKKSYSHYQIVPKP
jgi:hypothetical protein